MSEAEASGGAAPPSGEVRLERLYLKDCSFESPATPGVFGQQGFEPQINLEINTRTAKPSEDRFEVVLTVTVTATQNDATAFIVEVQQAGLFALRGLPDEVVHRALGTVCPNTLFPYVREAIDSLVVRGGFPALQLAPVNFEAAYAQALQEQRSRSH
jgi:preprotein translocase subunit SecB